MTNVLSTKRKIGPDSYFFLDANWKTCIKLANSKMADHLYQSNQLPDKNELNELCHTFGRKNEITIKVCKKVCRYIEGLSQHIGDVYPSREAVVLERIDGKEENIEIKFVVMTEQMSEEGRQKLETLINKSYDTLPVRDCNQLSSEETDLLKEHKYKLQGEALNIIKACLRQNANSLLTRHKYLSIVSGCPFKSIGHGTNSHRIKEMPCIVLNVPYKGYIPIDEEPFAESYNGVQIDVREDVFVSFGNRTTATERLDNLMSGCRISGEPDEHNHSSSGTLGGFFVHPQYGLCGISSLHAVLKPSVLLRLSEYDGEINLERSSSLFGNSEKTCLANVYQPKRNDDIDSTDDNKIGRLVKVRYRKGIEGSQDLDAYGMDVAIFQLSNRLPKSGKFPDVKVSENAEEYREIPVQFEKGDVEGFTWLDENKYSKYGATTGYTTTNLSINSTVSVKEVSMRIKDSDKAKASQFKFILHNQVSFEKGQICGHDIIPFDIKSDENINKLFAYFGDSGALVYRVNTDDKLLCVGMVVGGTICKKTCIVTPILPILKEIGITHFKNFDREEMENNVRIFMARQHNKSENHQRLQNAVNSIKRALGGLEELTQDKSDLEIEGKGEDCDKLSGTCNTFFPVKQIRLQCFSRFKAHSLDSDLMIANM